MAIHTFRGATLSLNRARALAPKSFSAAYDWFIVHEGEIAPRPYGKHAPANIDVKLAAQRGIHRPKNCPYALSITSTGSH